jgi:hypothetical protein
MADFEPLRLAARGFPDVEECVHRGGPAFRVGAKAFALW